jgi:hypothetical protein
LNEIFMGNLKRRIKQFSKPQKFRDTKNSSSQKGRGK